MKKQIAGFILGMLLGGVIIFTVASDDQHPRTWDYKVVITDLKYNVYTCYTDALKQAATNGWEVVSSQVVPNSSEIVSTENSTASVGLYIVLRRPEQ
jgi:hypothetical protein